MRILTPASGPGPNGGGGTFVKYTVPALELRRLLAEARALNESFRLQYTVLPGAMGDENWRRSAVGRTVTVDEYGQGASSCSTSCDGVLGIDLFGCECSATELALLPPPGPLAHKFLVQQAYPILEEDAPELTCFGP